MNKSNYFKFLLSLGVIGIMGCDNTPKEKVETAVEEVSYSKAVLDDAKENYITEIENYKKVASENLIANDQMLKEYKLKVQLEKSQAKKDYNKKIEALEQKNIEIKNRLNAFVTGDSLNWEVFKAKCNTDMNCIKKDISDICAPGKK